MDGVPLRELDPRYNRPTCGSSHACSLDSSHLPTHLIFSLTPSLTHDTIHRSVSWMRQQIGYIHQEPILFATSILENIRYAKPDATMDEVRGQAKAIKLPQGAGA